MYYFPLLQHNLKNGTTLPGDDNYSKPRDFIEKLVMISK